MKIILGTVLGTPCTSKNLLDKIHRNISVLQSDLNKHSTTNIQLHVNIIYMPELFPSTQWVYDCFSCCFAVSHH